MGSLVSLVLVIPAIVVSTVLHELMHGLVAYKLGDDTAKREGRLTLNPKEHIDPYLSIIVPVILYMLGAPIFGGAKPVPVNQHKLKGGAWGMALVAIMGPLTNLLLAFLAFVIAVATGIIVVNGDGAWITYTALGGYPATFLSVFIKINISLAMFNILPIPPLDGSRLLYALAPDSVREWMEKIEPYSIWIVMAIVLLFNTQVSELLSFLSGGIWGIFIGIVRLVI